MLSSDCSSGSVRPICLIDFRPGRAHLSWFSKPSLCIFQTVTQDLADSAPVMQFLVLLRLYRHADSRCSKYLTLTSRLILLLHSCITLGEFCGVWWPSKFFMASLNSLVCLFCDAVMGVNIWRDLAASSVEIFEKSADKCNLCWDCYTLLNFKSLAYAMRVQTSPAFPLLSHPIPFHSLWSTPSMFLPFNSARGAL